MSNGGRAGRTASTPTKFGYDEYVNRVDALLDELQRRTEQLMLNEAETDLLKLDLAVAQRGASTGATALTRILDLMQGRNYVSVEDVRRAIFGPF